MIIDLLVNIWQVFLDTAFWLLIGLLGAGFIKTFIKEETMHRWVGGHGLASIIKAALFGAPLPLCSCGVLPAAIGLHRAGASKEATVSFLISTPETSIDSVAVTYALMGPVMAIYRPIAALVSAIGTGLLTYYVSKLTATPCDTSVTSCCSAEAPLEKNTHRCCTVEDAPAADEPQSCCASGSTEALVVDNKLLQVIRYAGAELLDDIVKWLFIGIVLAGIMLTIFPPNWLAQWGQGFFAMLVMLVVGVPMYICAVASTPIAASLLLAGVSPGAVLVFLLVGPATNIASFALLKQELGLKTTFVYIFGLSALSLMMGLLLEWLLGFYHWTIVAKLGESHAMLPETLVWLSAFILIFLAIKPLRRRVFPQLG